MPAASALVVQVATPATRVLAAQPVMDTPASSKFTVPVASEAPSLGIVSVRTIEMALSWGEVSDDVKTGVEVAGAKVTSVATEVAESKVPSLALVAVTRQVPALELVSVAPLIEQPVAEPLVTL